MSARVGPALRPFEVATGFVWGREPAVAPLPRGRPIDLVASVEAELRRALADPPCRVAFSGGVDSSILLALAARVARREGLDLPFPVTCRFARSPSSEESGWQDAVLRYLDLGSRHVVLDLTDELDVLGPAATDLIRAGEDLYWPPNLHIQLELARTCGPGGTLITGRGGDEIFMRGTWHEFGRLVTAGRRPRRSEVRRLAAPLVPASLRTRLAPGRHDLEPPPWLNASAAAAWRRVAAGRTWGEPVSWVRSMRRAYWRDRYVSVPMIADATILRLCGVTMVNPFTAAGVIQAACSHFGLAGPSGRAEVVGDVFAGVLPPASLARSDKATLWGVFWTRRAADLAGPLVDWLPEAVTGHTDPRALLAVLRSGAEPPPTSFTMMQAAWWARERGLA